MLLLCLLSSSRLKRDITLLDQSLSTTESTKVPGLTSPIEQRERPQGGEQCRTCENGYMLRFVMFLQWKERSAEYHKSCVKTGLRYHSPVFFRVFESNRNVNLCRRLDHSLHAATSRTLTGPCLTTQDYSDPMSPPTLWLNPRGPMESTTKVGLNKASLRYQVLQSRCEPP